VPHDAATPTAVRPSLSAAEEVTDAPPSPADARTLVLSSADFADAAAGGPATARPIRFRLTNPHPNVLHVRLSVSGAGWLAVTPQEAALGPQDQQDIAVTVDVSRARAALKAGESPVAPVQMVWQHLFPTQPGRSPSPAGSGSVYVRLPVAACPSCQRIVDDDVRDGIPEACPFCFERLRPCPICGAPCSWLARHCPLDPTHVVRAAPDWAMLGGDTAHSGVVPATGRVAPLLSRRWSFPSVAPARREQALLWSAPVAAYGLVAAAAATHDGDTHLFAFDAVTGAPLWEPYPLPDPVYPERGGAAIASGRIYVATVDGACVCVDALRGTRVWETALQGRVYGAVVPIRTEAGTERLLVPAATSDSAGCLYIIDAESGRTLHQVPLASLPDSAPAFVDDTVFVHDDSGALTAVDVTTGAVRWAARGEVGFNSAPVLVDGRVFSADVAGMVRARDAATGEELWNLSVTNAPFSGTPACDGTLLYLPADDGLHIVSAPAGRAVRRYGMRRPVRGAPAVVGGTLFFGALDGNVYGVEGGRTLEKAYETGIGSQVVAALAAADGGLFVTATNGVLYALNVGAAAAAAAGAAAGEGRAGRGEQ